MQTRYFCFLKMHCLKILKENVEYRVLRGIAPTEKEEIFVKSKSNENFRLTKTLFCASVVLSFTGCSSQNNLVEKISRKNSAVLQNSKASEQNTPSKKGEIVESISTLSLAPFESRVVALTDPQLENLVAFQSDPSLPNAFRAMGAKKYSSDAMLANFDELRTERLFKKAESEAPVVVENLIKSVACVKANDSSEACIKSAVTYLSKVLFRRNPESIPSFQYFTFASDAIKSSSAQDAWPLVAEAMLVSPFSLFRIELRNKSDAPLQRKEVLDAGLAEALSYALTDRPPDDVLQKLTLSGSLKSQWDSQVQRLMATAHGKRKIAQFMAEYLEIGGRYFTEKPTDFAGQDWKETQVEVLDSFRRSAEDLAANPMDLLTRLLTTPDFFVGPKSAKIFDVPWDSAETSLVKMSPMGQPREARMGLLTHPAFLATFSEGANARLVQRGELIARKIACSMVPAPPGGVPSAADATLVAGTLRERLAVHKSNPVCAGCHKLMDPFGEPLERFDALGRARMLDNAKPVDTASELPAFAGNSERLKVKDHTELIAALSLNESVQRCFLANYLSFVSSREIPVGAFTSNGDLAGVYAAYNASGKRLSVALGAFFSSRTFSLFEP